MHFAPSVRGRAARPAPATAVCEPPKGVRTIGNKDFQHQDPKQQQPQARPPQQDVGGRKNDEEVGEPVQLDDDKSTKQGQQKPDMGQREGQKRGQPQGSDR